jgi:hypothetical protein
MNRYGPRIVTNDLALCLDAGDLTSYPGSGTVWTDLAQGLQFNSSGTTMPFGTYNGAKAFATNGSGYWICNTGYANVDMAGECTLLMWIYSTDITARKTIFQKNGTVYQPYQQEIAVTWETDERFSFYSGYPTYDNASVPSTGTPSIGTSGWYLIGIRMSSGKTANVSRIYYSSKNGYPWETRATGRNTNNAITPAGAIQIGSGYAGTVLSGAYIGKIMVYERMINNDEVKQIYNADRSRFNS